MEKEPESGGAKPELERNLGEQPLAGVMDENGYKSSDLVSASSLQLTHKMVGRARRGRRLTPNTKNKVHQAMAALLGRPIGMGELFNY
ncbi:MAG: hypothetical protein P8N31_04915 [Planctomycetota bacterium]|nr:hypothetical protein [Planctomycetota bacterium]MDG2142877.1 hypothetical protein [Planctomycetota bacterium]